MTALILGANSDVAVALARQLGAAGYNLQLAGRDLERLATLKSDLEIRHKISVTCHPFDALDFKSHYSFYQSLVTKPEVVILVFGYLGEHLKAIEDWAEAERILATNYTGAVSILNVVANDFERKKAGLIVGISSVAGERGRMSNYLYGSAKAGLTAYLSGLRNRLFHSGVHVMTVKPGFMRTRMTEGLKLPAPVTANPDQVAKKIFSAMNKRKNSIYVLPIWSLIMMMIRNVPEFMFKKLKL
jgi:decaprenylphospho-beta-D-erythro-pentofuranosid-2-ulose 2-reductase